MLKPLGAISLLLLTSALVAPSLAFAQSAEPAVAESAEPKKYKNNILWRLTSSN